MALADELQASVLVTLTALGGNITITQDTITPAAQAWKVTSTATATNVVKAVKSPFSTFERTLDAVQADDVRYFVAAKDMTLTPKVGDQIIDGSDRYTIATVETTQPPPGGAVIAYTLVARR